jgi:hypothetical protein
MCSMNPALLAGRHDAVAFGDQERANVAHDHRQYGVVARAADLHGHHRMVDTSRQAGHHPGPPDQVGAVDVIAGDPHDPVRCGAQVLDEKRFPADQDPLKPRPALAVTGPDLCPPGRPRQQLLY